MDIWTWIRSVYGEEQWWGEVHVGSSLHQAIQEPALISTTIFDKQGGILFSMALKLCHQLCWTSHLSLFCSKKGKWIIKRIQKEILTYLLLLTYRHTNGDIESSDRFEPMVVRGPRSTFSRLLPPLRVWSLSKQHSCLSSGAARRKKALVTCQSRRTMIWTRTYKRKNFIISPGLSK